MKAKKFNNLWTAGLILYVSILITTHIINIIFPSSIVGVALTPTIISFGQLIDGNIWFEYIFYSITFFIILYMLVCSCCEVKKLRTCEICIVSALIIICDIVSNLTYISYLLYYNTLFLIAPITVSVIRKINIIRSICRTIICTFTLCVTHILLLVIRDLTCYTSTAIYTVLLVDIYVVSTLLYLHTNYKGECQK